LKKKKPSALRAKKIEQVLFLRMGHFFGFDDTTFEKSRGPVGRLLVCLLCCGRWGGEVNLVKVRHTFHNLGTKFYRIMNHSKIATKEEPGHHDLIKEKKNIFVDLVLFLDNANKLHNNFDYQVKSNVGNVINFTSPKWSDNLYFFTDSGGVVTQYENNNLTKIINIPIPNTTHTSIDNKIPQDISFIIENFIKNNTDPIDFTKKYKF
jgi:hypothetical protein